MDAMAIDKCLTLTATVPFRGFLIFRKFLNLISEQLDCAIFDLQLVLDNFS